MARTGGSSALLGGLVLAAVARMVACGSGETTNTTTVQIRAVLTDFGPHVALPALADASAASSTLASQVEAWNVAVHNGGDASIALEEARVAWETVMEAWQVAELLQVGPAGDPLTTVGGEGRREAVYSWPEVNRCRVDQVTVDGGWDASDFFDVNLPTAYGLAALEVLLFSPTTENGCPPQVDINANETWNALSEAEIVGARASYAAALASRVQQDISALALAWDPAGGNYSGVLAAAGSAGSLYESDVAGLNAIFDALFYLESAAKERKLAVPLGLAGCTGTGCAEQVESPLAGVSNRWIQVNVAAFRTAYAGGAGAGLDDLLRGLGHVDLAVRLESAIDEAEAAALALDVPVEVAAQDDPAPAIAVYEAIDVVVDLLKGEVATVLVLQVPDEAAGDND